MPPKHSPLPNEQSRTAAQPHAADLHRQHRASRAETAGGERRAQRVAAGRAENPRVPWDSGVRRKLEVPRLRTEERGQRRWQCMPSITTGNLPFPLRAWKIPSWRRTMDRAAFLRSLSFLRPLPPGVLWDGSDDDGGPYSGSTITPPTPSKNNAMMLFEDSLFVVSIEPHFGSGECDNDNGAENGHQQHEHDSRKRDRSEDLPAARQDYLTVGPAFFLHRTEKSAGDDDDRAVNVMIKGGTTRADSDGGDQTTVANGDVEPDTSMQREDGGVDKSRTNLQINADPALCTFEAAIVKKLPLERGGDDNAPATPTKHRDEMDEIPSNALIFRFGNRFVFQVDESAIVELKFVPGEDGGSRASTPPSKRQRNEGGSASQVSDKTQGLPPSLIIVFQSCTFRVFSMEDKHNQHATDASNADNSRPSSRIWGTLAKPDESAESRLMNARSLLVQQFDIEQRIRENRLDRHSNWRMAPPGTGLAFHSWPESLENSSFHSHVPKYKVSNSLLEEDWSCCLRKKHSAELQSAAESPQKSNSSPSKTSGSSTHVEHGQDQAPDKVESSQSQPTQSVDIGKNGNKTASNDSSELTHESQQSEGGNSKKSKGVNEPQQTTECEHEEKLGMDVDDSEKTGENGHALEDVGQSHSNGRSLHHEAKEGNDVLDAESKKHNPESWQNGVHEKYHLFELSALHAERAMDPTKSSSQKQRNGTSISHPTLCAETLSHSYITAQEFMHASQECENEIENSTSEISELLDRAFPARGRKSNAVGHNKSEDCRSRIEELMKLRKQAVATKFSLLMVPKR